MKYSLFSELILLSILTILLIHPIEYVISGKILSYKDENYNQIIIKSIVTTIVLHLLFTWVKSLTSKKYKNINIKK